MEEEHGSGLMMDSGVFGSSCAGSSQEASAQQPGCLPLNICLGEEFCPLGSLQRQAIGLVH